MKNFKKISWRVSNIKNLTLIFALAIIVSVGFIYIHNPKPVSAMVPISPDEGGGSGGFTPNGSVIYLKFFAVVCDSEADLPNLDNPHPSYSGYGAVNKGFPDITEAYLFNTFLPSRPNCRTEDGWTFGYGKGVNNPPYTNDIPALPNLIKTAPTSNGVAVAQQPTSFLNDKWVEDYNYPRGSYGKPYTYEEQQGGLYQATTMIKEPRIYVAMINGPGSYEGNEWKINQGYVPNGYVDISTYNNPYPWVDQDSYSSELRCYDNHTGYDDYEYIRLPQGGITYSCIFFTAKLPVTPAEPATIKVDSTQCSVANWNITPGNFSGSGGGGGTYQGPAGMYFMSSVGVPSGYTYQVTNSDTNTPSMDVPAGETKTFYIKCIPPPPADPDPKVNLTVNGVKSISINQNESANLSWTTENVVSNGCTVYGGWSGTRGGSGSESTGNLTQSTNYGISCSNSAGVKVSDSVSVTVNGTPPVDDPLPPCTVDSFNDQWENNGWVYPTWATSLSNNVVLSGGQFGSGVAVEPDGQRTINIDSDTTLTITANAGASCSPSASRSAVMHAEATAMCTVSGLEYLPATDPNCKPPVPTCEFKNPYTNGDGFTDFSETGDGQTPIYWYSNANESMTLSGGPYSNYPVNYPNSDGYFIFPNITANTTVMLSGNNGMCTNSSTLYAASVPPKPSPFTAIPQACGTRTINLSWGEAPGSYNYKVFSNGNEIYSGPAWNPYGWKVIAEENLIPGQTYSYSVIGQSPNGNTEPNTATAVAPADCPTPPSVLLNVNPTNVPYNGTTNITWSTTGADSCTASGGWSGPKGTQSPAGGVPSGSLTANTTFTLNCTGPGGSGSDSKTVTVGSAGQADLRPYAPSTDSATVGTPLFFSGSIVNIGTGSTITSFKNFFQLANEFDGGGTYTDLAPVSMDPLDANASKQSDSPYYTFTSVAPYSIRICADKSSRGDGGTITELDENNNCSGWTNITVNPGAPSFDYNLTRSSGSLSVTQGNSVSNTIYKNLVSGTGSSVDLDVSGLPSGSGVSVSYVNRTCSPDCSSNLTFTALPTATPDTYNLTVTGSPLNKTTTFSLKINPTSALSVVCSASNAPGGNKINQPVVWTAVAQGGSQTYNSWSWSGTNIPTSPAPSANPYSITYTTTGTKTARATVTDSNGNQATCPDATTMINFDPTIIEF